MTTSNLQLELTEDEHTALVVLVLGELEILERVNSMPSVSLPDKEQYETQRHRLGAIVGKLAALDKGATR